MSQKNIVITGANTGIGFQTAKALYALGHNIIFGSRSQQKNIQALQLIIASAPKSVGSIKAFKLDLSKQASVQQFVKDVQRSFEVIDILINNAGLMIAQRQLNEKNIEMSMAINHFGHFYLTYLLFPRIKIAKEARIINVSSLMHNQTKQSTSQDLAAQNSYGSIKQYSLSKLANVQFTVGLAQRLSKYPNVKTFSLHPGSVDTNFGSQFKWLSCLKIVFCCCFIKPDTGARTSLFLATQPFQKLQNGQYYDSDTSIGNMNPLGSEKAAVESLWKVSEKTFGIQFRI